MIQGKALPDHTSDGQPHKMHGIDTQHILPRGSVEDVKQAVERCVEEMGEGGGYVVGAVHNIEPDVPVENILAMFQHAREYVPSYLRG